MSPHYGWPDLALRLSLDFVAAALIGINRDEHGRPAGMRTTILVSLAACVAMIQANLLINSTGKASDSFVVMDTMRLPLGILSGIGFIGAGAIIRRGELIAGVTTAATLWFVTVMGLCFGGGQLILGITAFALGLLTLTVLKKVEGAIRIEHRGELTVQFDRSQNHWDFPDRALENAGMVVIARSLASEKDCLISTLEVRWKNRREDTSPPSIILDLANAPTIRKFEFKLLN
jgi:putative Mg2+ transporter-C (MgtC) family protein